MKTKELVIMALFAAIGAALHSIIPPFLGGMKPDMMLIMMFMGILLFPRVQKCTRHRDRDRNHFRAYNRVSSWTDP